MPSIEYAVNGVLFHSGFYSKHYYHIIVHNVIDRMHARIWLFFMRTLHMNSAISVIYLSHCLNSKMLFNRLHHNIVSTKT